MHGQTEIPPISGYMNYPVDIKKDVPEMNSNLQVGVPDVNECKSNNYKRNVPCTHATQKMDSLLTI